MNTLLEKIRASAILMKNLPPTLSGDALLISREEARRIGYELEACAERMEHTSPASLKVESGLHNWQLEGSAGVWESYYKCGKCGKGARQDSDGPSLPLDGCEAASPKVPQGVEEWIAENGLQFVDTMGGFAVNLNRSKTCQYPCPEYLSVDDLRDYLSGMAIVPVERLKYLNDHHHATESGVGLARLALSRGDTQRAVKALDSASEKIDAALTMLAATKEKGE